MISHFISVDPGVTYTGIALWKTITDKTSLNYFQWQLKETSLIQNKLETSWEDRVFATCDEFRNLIRKMMAECWQEGQGKLSGVAIEYPEYYATSLVGQTAALAGSLVKLSILVGMYARVCQELSLNCLFIPAKQWKGQLPKQVVVNRLKKRFGDAYLKNVRKDAFDAIGVGLWILDSYSNGDIAPLVTLVQEQPITS